MSSTLAVDAGFAGLPFTKSHFDSFQHGSDTSQLTNFNGSGVNAWFQSGLPTPPVKQVMPGAAHRSFHGGHTSNVTYLDGPRNITATTDFRYPHYPTSSEPYARTESRPVFPSSREEHAQYHSSEKRHKDDQIASHLQIPESINNSKGSIAEFAAEITCLFWFETATTLEYAEKLALDALPDRGLEQDATPSVGFRKWVTTILSTTQVGKNVILLALMFIYRLKKFNPTVSGKRGSEFRLLTIALMLGNKFLDDNTYTNKTWAEVSGISVNEIHIMEVEFLSNMRYELYASESQWSEWKTKLGRFGSFYEKASRFERSKFNGPSTPLSQFTSHKLPSPPSATRSVNGSNYTALPNPTALIPSLSRSPVRQYFINDHPLERKRSLDPSSDLPPAKRMYHPSTTGAHISPVALPPNSALTTDPVGFLPGISASSETSASHRVPQLPMPHIPAQLNGSGVHLAPLGPQGSRSMASVYPVTTAGHSQPLTPLSSISTNMHQPYPASLPNLGEYARAPSNNSSAQTSPINMYGTSTPTRPGLSPSYFLTNRSSPYRPVRNVNTLLIPPPSAAMQSSVRNIGHDQMHYQPLSKIPTERHIGPVPYLQPDAWQNQASTPLSQQYRLY